MSSKPGAHPGAGRAVLVADLMALAPGADGRPDPAPFRDHVVSAGGRFLEGSRESGEALAPGTVHVFYRPDLRQEAELLAEASDGKYDAVIAAATLIPAGCRFDGGAVRVGAGTGNMQSESWGGRDGRGGIAPLMNTPAINARATAQMVMKALLRRRPDLPFDALHGLVTAGDFDTGRDLAGYATAKLEGRVMAVLGYGNIGREVARLAAAFGMTVRVFARPAHRDWIEADGHVFAASAVEAARGADALSIHLGLGALDPRTGRTANAGIVSDDILGALASKAMLVNFDRGEVVDVPALDRALSRGQVDQAAIDADIFLDAGGGPHGPLAAYLPLAARYGERVLLLPHAVADTDHASRVAGGRLAFDLVVDAMTNRRVRNLVGDLPEGYVNAGSALPPGIGPVGAAALLALAQQGAAAELAAQARLLATFYDRLAQAAVHATPESSYDADAAEALLAGARLSRALRRHGLLVPYKPG